jgi:hypothetical protein
MYIIGEINKISFYFNPGSYSRTSRIFKKGVPNGILGQFIFIYFLNILAIVIYPKTKTSPLSFIVKELDF